MGLTDIACDFHTTNMIGGATTNFDNANAALGVGDDNTVFATSQTQLQAEALATSAIRKSMDTGYPSQDPESAGDNNKVRYQATFAPTEGNFQWNEWGLFNTITAGAGVMHNREVETIGTKTNVTTWVFQVDISLIT